MRGYWEGNSSISIFLAELWKSLNSVTIGMEFRETGALSVRIDIKHTVVLGDNGEPLVLDSYPKPKTKSSPSPGVMDMVLPPSPGVMGIKRRGVTHPKCVKRP